MKFEEVLTALREGKKIRRKDIVWQNYYGFLFISETENEIFSDSVVDCHYRITTDDLNTDDWEIYQELLLTEEEKTFIKAVLNIAKNRKIEGIKLQYSPYCAKYFLYFMCDEFRTLFSFQLLKDRTYFKNLELDDYYTLEELELND